MKKSKTSTTEPCKTVAGIPEGVVSDEISVSADHDIKIIESKVFRTYKAGYVVKDELWVYGKEDPIKVRSAYTPSGDMIGTSKDAYYLCVTRGIKPEKIAPESSVCSIGFCEKEKTWYGWSHRARCGFKLGNKLFDENWAPKDGSSTDNILFIERGGRRIRTYKEAKQAAINFARYVS